MQAASDIASGICATVDAECLRAWRREPATDNLRPLIERYATFVFSSAYRRTSNPEQAAEVTRAVFLVLARRARKLRGKPVLAGWLFHVTRVACRKLLGQSRLADWWHRLWRKRQSQPPPDTPLWPRVAPELDAALDRLSGAKRNAVLLRVLLNRDWTSVTETLRTTGRRADKRVQRGLKKLTARLHRRGVPAEADALAQVCSVEGCAAPLPADLVASIFCSIEATAGKKPALKLARRTLNALAWARWCRRVVIGVLAFDLFLAVLGAVAWHLDARSGHSRLISAVVIWSLRYKAWSTPGLAELARPWTPTAATRALDAGAVRNAQDLYHTTNIWLADLSFTREQWKALTPKSIGPMPHFMRPDGRWFLSNPQARRSGILGVLGYEFDWTHADFEFGGLSFTNVAARIKGNLLTFCGPKQAFKVDLNHFARGQRLGGLDQLAFNSLFWDYSCVGEALGYEFFRDAGVPASRTAYAWLSISVARQWDRKPFGLYLLLEPVDRVFVAERFGSKETPLFKPVTYDLFKHLGEDWAAYARIYDLKTQATPEQQRRVIDFARLVTSAPDATFTAQVGDFLDLDEFARFLAGEVLLSNYDTLLTDGQNYFMYLDPRSNKFGFIPWDLDSAWGDFWVASKPELARASIWHPWAGENRFLQRLMAVEEFRRLYRRHLEDLLGRVFVPDRLSRRIDELAAVIRDPMMAESAFRRDKFEQAVGFKPLKPAPGERPNGLNHPPNQIKRFVEIRAKSVRQQLDGKSAGLILKYPSQR
jgi:DNA-directed RNA polymerase specialized sigma24 family protein